MRLVFAFLFLGLLASAWAANVFLGDLAEEEDARIRREHAEKVFVLTPPAEGGSANAQYKLGALYLTAHELVQDSVTAFEWFKRSATSGHAEAQYNLGRLYERGEGVQQNYGSAARWYGRSAEHANHGESQYALGQLNFRGLAPGHSRTQALKWFRRAADNGQPVAQFLVGRMFESGWGVRKDAIEAHMWYSLAERGRDRVLAENSEYDPTKAIADIAKSMNQSQRDLAIKAAKTWIVAN